MLTSKIRRLTGGRHHGDDFPRDPRTGSAACAKRWSQHRAAAWLLGVTVAITVAGCGSTAAPSPTPTTNAAQATATTSSRTPQSGGAPLSLLSLLFSKAVTPVGIQPAGSGTHAAPSAALHQAAFTSAAWEAEFTSYPER